MILKTITVVSFALCVLGDGPHAISEQRIKIYQTEHHGDLKHIGSQPPEHHEEYAWSYPSYEFSYEVHDPHTHDMKGQKESRYGDEVNGEYWLIQPDGHKRTVKYSADKHSGFKADVKYSEYQHDHKHKIEDKPKEEIKPVKEKVPMEDKKDNSDEKGVEKKHKDDKKYGSEEKRDDDAKWDKHDKHVDDRKEEDGRRGEESRGYEGYSGGWGKRRVIIRGRDNHREDRRKDAHDKQVDSRRSDEKRGDRDDRIGDLHDHVTIVKNLGSFGERKSGRGEGRGHNEGHKRDENRGRDEQDDGHLKPARNIPYYVRDPYSHPRFYRRSHDGTGSSRH